MRIEALVTIKGVPPGGKTSPGGLATVDPAQGRVLAGLGFARVIDAGEAASTEEARMAAPAVEPIVEAAPEPVAAPVAAPAAPATTEPTPAPEAAPAASEGEGEGKATASRLDDIKAAIELLDEDDFVKTGERAGRPRVKAVEAVLGFDVTMAEVDEAFALREAEA